MRPAFAAGSSIDSLSNETGTTGFVSVQQGGASLRFGLLPETLFPPAVPGAYVAARETALIGRSQRPSAGHPSKTTPGDRLRLDRYDMQDFDMLRSAMVADGLWKLKSPNRNALLGVEA